MRSFALQWRLWRCRLSTQPTRVRSLVLAIAASAALVAAAPFVGVVRSQIRAAFPAQFSLIINAIVAISVLGAVGFGLARVRERRVARYSAMALAILIAAVYARVTGSPDPNISSVEHFHFVEYGTITFLFYRVWRDRADWSALATPLVAAFIVGIAEEGYQWFLPARVGELKDVWLNGIAIGCGLLFTLGAAPLPAFSRRWHAGSLRLTARTTAVAVLALAAFIHVVHLGVEIHDRDAGRFVSRYTAGELAALDTARATSWKLAPPLVRPARFSREDQFMTEGLQHVQARNKAWDGGNVAAAWSENLILERYFPSVLDTPSYVERAGHRWSAEHRADAAARVAGQTHQSYVSAAYPYPLYLWSPVLLWFVAGAVAAILWGAVPDRLGALRSS